MCTIFACQRKQGQGHLDGKQGQGPGQGQGQGLIAEECSVVHLALPLTCTADIFRHGCGSCTLIPSDVLVAVAAKIEYDARQPQGDYIPGRDH